MSTNTLLTNQKLYVILTYINITGTYMVMASIDDKTTDIKINTFLRLGAGSSTNDVKPIVVQPKLIGLGWSKSTSRQRSTMIVLFYGFLFFFHPFSISNFKSSFGSLFFPVKILIWLLSFLYYAETCRKSLYFFKKLKIFYEFQWAFDKDLIFRNPIDFVGLN